MAASQAQVADAQLLFHPSAGRHDVEVGAGVENERPPLQHHLARHRLNG